tara:strand:+ start:277 stop:582 length:306 start_codon:yes stop_codon:yes gene_type:complete
MANFPHQITMSKYGLSEDDISNEAQEALEDFNSYLDSLQNKAEQAEKDGEQFEYSESQIRKINRLSEAVCSTIEDMIDSDDDDSSGKNESEGGFDLFAWTR